MSVGDQLRLDENSDLLDQARRRWPNWVAADARLDAVAQFDDLRAWLSRVDREAADGVLVTLAMLASPDGGDDIAAAAALAKCLLPGACRLAARLSRRPPQEVFRDSQPVMSGTWCAIERIDELVASQLWIEVRSFPWRRLRKVAANILMNTRVGVLREVGDSFQVSRADRTWANTTLIESIPAGDLAPRGAGVVRAGELPAERPAGALIHRSDPRADRNGPDHHKPSPAEELLELLAWGCENRVISDADRHLLLCLVEEAYHVQTRNLTRGYGGLIGNELSTRVPPGSESPRPPSVATPHAACAPSPLPRRGSSAMTSDRPHRLARLRQMEEAKTMTTSQEDAARTPAEVAELFAIAGREVEAIHLLTGCVEQLHRVQAAKAQLATLTTAEVRAALEYRRAGHGEAQ